MTNAERNPTDIVRAFEFEDKIVKLFATITIGYIIVFPLVLLVLCWRSDFNGDAEFTISDISLWIQAALSEPFFFLRELSPTIARFLELSVVREPTIITSLVGFMTIITSDILLFMFALNIGNEHAERRAIVDQARREIAASDLTNKKNQ